MRAFACDHFEVELPPTHRFPMGKYAALRERLLAEEVLGPADIVRAEAAPLEAILAVHEEAYVRGFLAGGLDRKAVQRIGFPWSEALVARTLGSAGATLLAAEWALEHGFAGSLAGGTHHAYRDQGSGYCVFNDLAMATRLLLDRGLAKRVLIVDVDVHQGDGTAAMLADEPAAFTLSMHGARNFPARKQVSDLDVALPDGTADGAYLEALDGALAEGFERGRPDFVLMQGGVDVLDEDRLGRLALSPAGVAERDRRVMRAAHTRGVPLVTTLGGGYAEPIDLSIAAHINTWRVAASIWRE